MLANYFKIAWRTLFRNKLHTAINIGGLIIGFTIGISILLVVYGQYNFDRSHAKGNRLYEAYQVFNNPDKEAIENQFGLPAAPAYRAESPLVNGYSRFTEAGNRVEYNGKSYLIPVTLADKDFFSMFTIPVVKGNRQNPLASLTDIILSEEAAGIIFGKEDPVGKHVKAMTGDQLVDLTVSAVVKNMSYSSLGFSVLARIENRYDYAGQRYNWSNRSCKVFIELKEGAAPQQAEQDFRAIDRKSVPEWYTDMTKKGARPDRNGDLFSTRLLPLKDMHLSTRVNGHKAVPTLQIVSLLTVGLLIIFIACFNFVNINIATAFTRAREIGVRKCLGAARWKLFGQLWSESFLVSLLSFLLSLLLVNILLQSIEGIRNAQNSPVPLLREPGFVALALALLLGVSLLAGGYPSFVMTRFKVVESLKGNLRPGGKNILQRTLIVIQFMIACIMISCTFIIYMQFRYLQNADLGINKDHVVSIPLSKAETGRETIRLLRNRLLTDPHILSVTGSNINIGRGVDHRTIKSSMGFDFKGKQISTNLATIDYDYLKTFGLQTKEGRDFDRSFPVDTANRVLISESMARQFGEKNLVGTRISGDSANSGWEVIGIFPDFHLYSMAEKIEPLMLNLDQHAPVAYCFIKVTPRNLPATMATIKKEMALLEPGQDFKGTFVDENVQGWYQTEKVMSVLFSIAAVVAVFLSCSGLLAMVLLVIQQRVKEIGVRKVLGASVNNISLLIAKNFLFLVLLAVVIATPIAWLLMGEWLKSFPYRIGLNPGVFVLVGLTALVIAALTICINTIRAAQQNPIKSLRTE